MIVEDFVIASLLLWSATFSRFERFGFEVSCVIGPSDEIDVAVDRDP